MGVGEIDFVNIWRRPTLLTYAVTIRRLLLRTLQWLLASLWVRFKVLTHLTTIPFILQPLQCPSPAGPCCYNTGFVSSSCACLQPQDVCSSDSSAWCYVLPYTIRLSCSSCSAAQSCLTLCNPMDSSTPGFLIHHQLQELAQTQIHWVGDAIQPTYPLLSRSPPAFSLFQRQGLFHQFFTTGGQSIGASASASVLPMNIQGVFPLRLTGWSPCSPRDSQFTTVHKHQFFGTQPSLWSNAHIHTWLLEKP